MLSKHPERCRIPHGHTRTIEIVLSSDSLDANDMVADFKALKLMVGDFVERFDHAMALNSNDPLLEAIQAVHPDGLLVYQDTDPTTEVMAKEIYDEVERGIREGFSGKSKAGCTYSISAERGLMVDRVRVWETPTSWAEYGS
jgi:6-pyruvoyltetrahydropterin/6-carboxytetrahydropterin synthase